MYMGENIFVGRPENQARPEVDAYLASALETFPKSRLLVKIAELSPENRKGIEYALNLIGEPVALFGDFEESSEEGAIAEIVEKIDAFVQAPDDQKRSLAKMLVESVRS